ncbi:uncharacterized protein LOC122510598 [Leptopilina heterotoma]|uniref:uncharacterized protein LOC122510598 n=1 Tax=Leptopilina heterotoma TaxID=63436 RepID=UPI001CA95DC0|nr:uncharacterized protein LOC122510598 [Leptopilina heterotoma]
MAGKFKRKDYQWEDTWDTASDICKEITAELEEVPKIKQIAPVKVQGKMRMRRSVPLLGFIGRIAGPIVGVLSYEDGEHIQDQIRELNVAEANLTHLVGRQTHLVRAQLDSLYKRANAQKINIELINKQLNDLTNLINQAHKGAAHQTFFNNIGKYLNKIKTQIIHNSKTGSRLLETVRDARKGQVHPGLISISQILPILRDIQDHQPTVTLPVKGPNYSLEEIVQTSKTTVLFEEGHLKILIDIPLLEKPDYVLYKLHPFPVFQQIYGNISGKVSIDSPYTHILVDDPLRTYMLVKEGELDSCKQTTDYLLCQNSLPIYEIRSQPSCEVQLLLNPTNEILRNCKIQLEYQEEDHWIKLKTLGGWLYSIQNSTTINIRCNSKTSSKITIQGLGLMQLASGCYASTPYSIIPSIPKIQGITELIYESEIGLSIDSLAPKIASLKTSQEELKLAFPETKGFYKNSQSLDELEQQLHEFSLQQMEKGYQQTWIKGTYLGIITFSLMIFILWLITKIFQHPKFKNISTLKSKKKSHCITGLIPMRVNAPRETYDVAAASLPTASPRKRSDVNNVFSQKELEIRKAYAVLPFAEPTPGTSNEDGSEHRRKKTDRIETTTRRSPYPKVTYPEVDSFSNQPTN